MLLDHLTAVNMKGTFEVSHYQTIQKLSRLVIFTLFNSKIGQIATEMAAKDIKIQPKVFSSFTISDEKLEFFEVNSNSESMLGKKLFLPRVPCLPKCAIRIFCNWANTAQCHKILK